MTDKQLKALNELEIIKRKQSLQILSFLAFGVVMLFVVYFFPKLFFSGENLSDNIAFTGYINKIFSKFFEILPFIAGLLLFVGLIIWLVSVTKLNRLAKKLKKEIDPEEIDKILEKFELEYLLEELKSENPFKRQDS